MREVTPTVWLGYFPNLWAATLTIVFTREVSLNITGVVGQQTEPALGTKVQDLMATLIDQYFATHLELSWDDAVKLHKEYYTNYGLAIEGLVRHHQIDPIVYNAEVDDALPLEDIIKPNPQLRELLKDIDTSKVTLWLLTNAYVTHAKRVVRLLQIEDIFEGLTYCDYNQRPLICKPQLEMFQKAMRDAGVDHVEECFFVGTTRPHVSPFQMRCVTDCSRRLFLELLQISGDWMDDCALGRGGTPSSSEASLEISNTESDRAARCISPILQIDFLLKVGSDGMHTGRKPTAQQSSRTVLDLPTCRHRILQIDNIPKLHSQF